MSRQSSKTVPKTVPKTGPKVRRKKVELKRTIVKTVPEAIRSVSVGLDAFKLIAQSALDAIPTGFCVCRPDRSLIRYNRRAVELWGCELPLGEPASRYGGNLKRYQADGARPPFASTPGAQA